MSKFFINLQNQMTLFLGFLTSALKRVWSFLSTKVITVPIVVWQNLTFVFLILFYVFFAIFLGCFEVYSDRFELVLQEDFTLIGCLTKIIIEYPYLILFFFLSVVCTLGLQLTKLFYPDLIIRGGFWLKIVNCLSLGSFVFLLFRRASWCIATMVSNISQSKDVVLDLSNIGIQVFKLWTKEEKNKK